MDYYKLNIMSPSIDTFILFGVFGTYFDGQHSLLENELFLISQPFYVLTKKNILNFDSLYC